MSADKPTTRVLAITHYVPGVRPKLYIVTVPTLGQPKGYVSAVSVQCFENFNLRMVWGRKQPQDPVPGLNCEHCSVDMFPTTGVTLDQYIEQQTHTQENPHSCDLNVIHVTGIFEFYAMIGFDHKKRKYIKIQEKKVA